MCRSCCTSAAAIRTLACAITSHETTAPPDELDWFKIDFKRVESFPARPGIAPAAQAILISAGVLGALALAPGLPKLPFLALAAGVGWYGNQLRLQRLKPERRDTAQRSIRCSIPLMAARSHAQEN